MRQRTGRRDIAEVEGGKVEEEVEMDMKETVIAEKME